MKFNIFSPVLITLIIILFIKAVTLIDRVQEQTVPDTYTNSVLIDSAYAKDESSTKAPKEAINIISQNKELDSNTIPHSNKESTPPIAQGLLPQEIAAPNMSSAELQLLKELSKRRLDLDKANEAITIREHVLKATENKIDQKVAELKARQAKLEEIIKQYNQKENSKIMSLVKIYENMKPRDAAKIFDELEMPVLLEVVSNMKEIRVAPVIAGMNPMKARDLSIEMAKHRTLN